MSDTQEQHFAEPEAETFTFSVADDEAGQRLDAFLAERIGTLSRSAIKRLVDDGDVLLDGRVVKPSYKLRGGEEIEVESPPPPPLEIAPEDIPLDIVYEDDALVVVNKPAGLVVHPAAGVHSGTLANALVHHFRQLPTRGGETRPGIVHRLDRDTSGLVVVAKTAQAHENLSDQFRAREVHKSYVALVHGRVEEERGRVEEPLGRDPRNRTRMAVRRGGRSAITQWRVRRRYGRFTLLDVEIKTGRTHQIRVHAAWMKHPVVGDETYNEGRDKNVSDPSLRARLKALGRQFLHAERLAFRHPLTGERPLFVAPLPPELSTFLEGLEADAAK